MFTGEYSHNLDAKGRVSMPSKFRSGAENEKFYVTISPDGCLNVFDQEGWDEFSTKLNSLPKLTNPKAARFVRNITAGTSECSVDKLGRILIPENLRNYAHIEKEVRIIGVLDRIEIWNAQQYEFNADHYTAEDMREDMSSMELDF